MPTIEEFTELRKGLRKRKRPQLSIEMFGDAPGIGYFEVLERGESMYLQWRLDVDGTQSESRCFGYDELSNLTDLELERFEVGMLISRIFNEHGREIRNSIPGPREAMMASNPYFDASEKWEHWAKVAPGFFLK